MTKRNNVSNPYFDGLLELCREHDLKIQAHNALKADLHSDGVSEEQRDAWWAKSKALQDAYPAKGGTAKAMRAWFYGSNSELEMNDFLWEREVHDFVAALKSAGLKSFTYTNNSTAVMENIHAFIAEGCKLVGPCKVYETTERFGSPETETRLGLRFKLG